MRSMTGYSKLNYEDENYVINMEIKSVNNKNLATKIKLPYNLPTLILILFLNEYAKNSSLLARFLNG